MVFFGLWLVPLCLALAQSELRRRLLEADRLPVLVFGGLSLTALWWSLHQSHEEGDPGGGEPDGAPPFWRGFSTADLIAGCVAVLAAGAAALAFGTPAAPILDPARPSDLDRVPWFLLGLAESAAWLDPRWLVLLAFAALWALPHLDVASENDAGGFETRRGTVYFVLFAWFLLGLLPMIQAALRPPEAPAVLPAPSFPSLSARLWRIFGLASPALTVVREAPALITGGVWFLLVPWLLGRGGPMRVVVGRFRKRLGPWRFRAAMFLMLLVLLVPLRMIAHQTLGLGPFLDLPEIGLRF